jgi:predicted small lipoprotein YifL
MKKILLAALALSPLLAGCGGPLLFAQVEVPQVKITLPSQEFPATDAGSQYWCTPTQTQPDCIAMSLAYDLGAQLPVVTEQNVTYAIRLTSLAIALATTSGGTDLGGVKAVAVRVRDAAAGGDGVVVAGYARSDADPNPTAIAVTGNSNVDLAAYVQSGELDVRVEMTYDAPTPAFTADVTSTWSLDVKLDWGAYL